MQNILAALAVAASLTAGAAAAQSESATMDVGLSMIELAASREFTKLGIDIDPMSLSLNQLAQIKSVIGSSDYTVNEKKQQVEAIIARN